MEGRLTLAQVRAIRLGVVRWGIVLGLAPLGLSLGLGESSLAQSLAQSVAQSAAGNGAAIAPLYAALPSVQRPDLELGFEGGSVAELQGVLKLLGFYLGDVNGLYDEATSLAVVRFQAAAQLPQTGRVSSNTWNALFPLDTPSPTIATAPNPPISAPASQSPAPQPTTPQPTAPQSPAPNPQPASAAPTPAAAQPASPQPSPTAVAPTAAAPQAAAPQTAPQPNPYPTLKLGEKGDAVARLQRRLVEKGFLDGQADGDFGPMTEAAVKAAQEALGLEVDGIVGPATWRALLK